MEGLERVTRTLPETSSLLQRGMEQGWHPGGQLYVSLKGEALLDEGFGEAAPDAPYTSETLSLWLSACKPVTAVGVLRCAQSGLLDLDDPVVTFIPAFGEHGKERISLRHLLTHTAGIRNADIGWKPRPWAESIQRICESRPEPRWEPGEKAGYHVDAAWYMLGAVIEQVTSSPLDAWLRREVLVPSGATGSYLGIPAERVPELASRVSALWDTSLNPPEERTLYRQPRVLALVRPGGNGRGPASDLGRFYEALLSEDSGLLDEPWRRALVTRSREGLFDQTFRHIMDWGLGVMLNSNRYGAETVPYGFGRSAGPDTFGHGGNQSSTGFADPAHGLVVALIFNGQPGEPVHQARMRDALSALYRDLDL